MHFYRIKNKLRFVLQPVIIEVRLVNEREEKIIKLLFFFEKNKCKIIDNSRLECSSVSGDI